MGLIDRAVQAIDRSGVVKHHFPALTGFRAFTCLHVVMYHLFKPMLAGAPTLARNGLRASTFGFFFVLSGFLLGCGYGRKMLSREGKAVFYQKRFARIYPVYFLMILAWLPILAYRLLPWLRTGSVAGLQHEGPLASFKALGASLLMVQAWFQSTAHVINPPTWSLSVEMFLYAIFPWLFLGVHRLRQRAGTGGALVLAVALQLLNAAILLLNAMEPAALQASDEGAGYLRFFVSYHPFSWIAPFSMGLMLSLAFEEGGRKGMAHPQRLFLGAFAFVAAALLFLPDRAVLLARIGLLSLPFGGIIYALASADPASTGLFRFLSSKAMVLIGSASYTIYACHVVLFNYLAFGTAKLLGLGVMRIQASLLFGVIYLAVLVLVGILLHLYVEIPLNRKVAAWFQRRRASAPSQEIEVPVQ